MCRHVYNRSFWSKKSFFSTFAASTNELVLNVFLTLHDHHQALLSSSLNSALIFWKKNLNLFYKSCRSHASNKRPDKSQVKIHQKYFDFVSSGFEKSMFIIV
jgi:hypothetical protein